MQRKSIALSKRFEIMKRDGFKCVVCGRTPSTTIGLVLEIDHIVPHSKGGSDRKDNLRTTCFDCNRGKHSKIITNNYQSDSDTQPIIDVNIQKQKIPVIKYEIYNRLDPYHRAGAEVLSLHGELIIEGVTVV